MKDIRLQPRTRAPEKKERSPWLLFVLIPASFGLGYTFYGIGNVAMATGEYVSALAYQLIRSSECAPQTGGGDTNTPEFVPENAAKESELNTAEPTE